MHPKPALLWILMLALVCQVHAETFVSTNSSWRYFKGLSEASFPTNAWREIEFNDSAWLTGAAPFHYGTNAAGGDDTQFGGTILSDMRSNYTCIFMRQPFVLTDTNLVLRLNLNFYFDDGFAVWINGRSARAPVGMGNDFSYTNRASSPSREANTLNPQDISAAIANLVNGTNILCIQAFNGNLTNDDFRIDVELVATYRDIAGPVVTSTIPAAGSLVSNLTQITVQFDEPVQGVVAPDFMLNGNPCTSVTGSSNAYTFTFTQPLPGTVRAQWDLNHTVYDLVGNRFDETRPSATWEYTLIDGTSPTLMSVSPLPGATLSNLTEIEVVFSEPVSGVDAGDLLVEGQPATSVVPTVTGGYLFRYAGVPSGVVAVNWAAGHNIADLAPVPNAFAGGGWSYTNDPAAPFGDIIISEICAENLTGLLDEDAQQNDWIELYNRSTNTVNLLGWSLTDDPAQPRLWEFPNVSISNGQYLVVFASGKSRKPTTPGSRLHTNFRLNPFGEYLGLYNPQLPSQVVSEFVPQFPEQRSDIGYGVTPGGALAYFATPTPGAPNPAAPVYAGMAHAPAASVKSGLFNQPFNLALSTETPESRIYYTLDGSPPGPTNALYTGPIPIAGSSNKAVVIVRAAAFKTNWLSSSVTTRSYIFPDYVVNQPNNPAGFPAVWDSPCSSSQNCVDIPADYEMDPQIVTNGNSAAVIRAGLTKLPSLSIVTHVDLLFGPVKGVYVRREDWNQQPVNAELIFPDGTDGFNTPAGLEIQGGTSPYDQSPSWKSKKLSMRLLFKGDFGAKNLDYPVFPDSPVTKFNTLVLDNGLNHVWHYNGGSSAEQQRQTAQYVRDTFMSDQQIAAGDPSAHWRFVHVYLNGLYWGITGLHERPDDKWAAEYFGGDESDYDVLRHNNNNVVAGNNTAYNAMFTLARQGLALNSRYEQLQQQYLDLPWFIDYMIINIWAGNNDWAHQNWYTVRRRQPAGLFRFVSWDAEHVIENLSYNRLTDTGNRLGPLELYDLLAANAEFKVLVGDHLHKHFFNGGIFHVASNTPVNLDNAGGNQPAATYLKRIQQVDGVMVGESARWGDAGSTSTDRSNNPLTRDRDWLSQLRSLMGLTNALGEHNAVYNYFPTRSATVLNQFRTAGMYPALSAPAFRQHGGRVPGSYSLFITNTAGVGTNFYTVTGVDPRVYGTGAIASQARVATNNMAIPLNRTVLVRARTFHTNAWSALTEALFTVNELGVPLHITEIMYHPLGGEFYEFVELHNAGEIPLDLGGYTLEGVTFGFPPGSTLAPGGTLILASAANTNAFSARYPGVAVAGFYEGSLANGGERLAVRDARGQTVCSVNFNDQNGWPVAADGAGFSLELMDLARDPNDPANWRASAAIYGTPGLRTVFPATAGVVLNEIMADNVSSVTNAGACPDWIELYNAGSNAMSLAGWSLSDGGDLRRFVFPETVLLEAGAYLVVWCDTDTNAPGLHTGFALNRSGESLFLYDANTNRLDAASFGLQLADLSVGRLAGDWELTLPTPGTANQAAALASTTNLVLNEWLANPVTGGPDWLELHNVAANAPVALRGIYLGTSNALYQLRSLSFAPPGGFVQLFADEGVGPDHLDFRLPKEGGLIVLYSETGAELSRVTYGPLPVNVSQGRLPNGSQSIVSFASSQSPAASNYVISYSGPVLNEIMARNRAAVVGPYGSYPDWVEFVNTNETAFDLSGMSLSDSASQAAKWVFPIGTSIPAKGYLVIWCDSSRPASTAAGGVLNTGFDLAGSGGGVYLFNSLGQRLDAIEYGFQPADLSIGRAGSQWMLLATPSAGYANGASAMLGASAALRVNEWMAAPTGGPDWFELYNADPLPVDMSGLYLTDNPSINGITNFQVGPLSFVGGRSWVVWVADADPGQGRDHVNFALDADGDTLRLYAQDATLIDAVDFGLQADDVSQGRLPDAAGAIVSFPLSSSPGAANYLPLPDVVINEVLAHTDPPLEDAIELQNLSSNAVDISGWYLSNTENDPRRYRIPPESVLQPYGFAVFYEYQFNTNGGVPPAFTLNSAHGDRVILSQADTNGQVTGYRASVSFGASENAVSFGRHATSLGVDFVAQSARSFGEDNPPVLPAFRQGTGLSNAYPRVGPLVMNEIMYHPVTVSGGSLIENPDEEYLELHNLSSTNVALFDPEHATNHWRISGGVAYEFSGTPVIPARGFALVVRFDPAADVTALANFRAKYRLDTNVIVFGPWSGRLDNAGETVELLKPDVPQISPPDAGYVPYILVDHVRYDDTNAWPTAADGGGAALQRITASAYGNDPVNWRADAGTPGAPNEPLTNAPPTVVNQPQSRGEILGQPASFTVVVAGTQPLVYQWLLDGSEIPNATNDSYAIAAVQSADAGAYSVRVWNAFGTNQSLPATLTVLIPPAIQSLEPGDLTLNAGSSLSLNVTATGSLPLRYQWLRDGRELPGETESVLAIAAIQPDQAGAYQVVVTNLAGAVTSAVMTVTVAVPPLITGHPLSQAITEGSNAVFAVSAVGDPPLTYQWFVNSNLIQGATSPTLVVTNATLSDDGNQYQVVVSNGAGSAASLPAMLTVLVRPILVQVELVSGDLLRFTINGTPGRSYWLQSASSLAGSWQTDTNQLYTSGQTVVVGTVTNGMQLFYRAQLAP